jgi:outer membrane receptor protein involved in Fe transport
MLLLFGIMSPSFSPGDSAAQNTGSVLGRVFGGPENSTLPNALISISGTALQVLSGNEGWFILTGLPPGRHEITVELAGFALGVDTVDVQADSAIHKDFRLQPNPVPLDELVVSADARAEGAVNRRIITREEIDRRQAGTLTQLLQGLVPGVTQTVTSGDVGAAARIRIRGVRSLEGTPPLFFLDGVLVGSARFDGPAGTGRILTFLDNINPKDIERIEILYSAEATTVFGTDAAGGAILIYTKR